MGLVSPDWFFCLCLAFPLAVQSEVLIENCMLCVGLLSCLCVSSCGGGGGGSSSTPSPIPSVQSFSPTSAAAGSDGFQLTINGSGFTSGSAVTWSGSPERNKVVVSSSLMTVMVQPADLADVGSPTVTITNSAPGGGQSSFQFSVTQPTAPAVSAVSPAGVIVG